jgi:ribosome-associated translation inhibitor RaiA/cold shock CspA family protein
METPLEITFHNLPSSPAVEADIQKRVAKLEKINDGIISCRVSVESLHNQHKTGNTYEVHIELHLPGKTLVVSREPHHIKENHARGDVLTSVRDAFKAAEAQLRSFSKKRQGEVKPHAAPFQGRVSEIHRDKDFGYLTTNEGELLYFHRNSVMNGDFDKLELGEQIQFVESLGDTGPTASKVWSAAMSRQD